MILLVVEGYLLNAAQYTNTIIAPTLKDNGEWIIGTDFLFHQILKYLNAAQYANTIIAPTLKDNGEQTIGTDFLFHQILKWYYCTCILYLVLLVGSPSLGLMCWGSVECASFPGGTAWSPKSGCRSLPWTGPLGGLWTTCVRPEQTRPHPRGRGALLREYTALLD